MLRDNYSLIKMNVINNTPLNNKFMEANNN